MNICATCPPQYVSSSRTTWAPGAGCPPCGRADFGRRRPVGRRQGA